MFPDGHHVSFADSFMSAFRLKVSNTNKAVLAVQLTILRHNIAIVAIACQTWPIPSMAVE